MPITIAWDNTDHTIVRLTFTGHWGWDEFYAAHTSTYDLMDHQLHPVPILIDLQHNQAIPKNMLVHLRKLSLNAHPNAGSVVVVGANKIIQAITDIVQRVYGGTGWQFRMVPTLEAGRQLLAPSL